MAAALQIICLWFLAAAATAAPDVIAQPLLVRGGGVGFERLGPDRTGIQFTNRLSDDAAAENQIRLNGSGVALGDVDGDGRVDLFFCSLQGSNRLYRNLGDFKFEDLTGQQPFALPGHYCTGAALADVDGDGYLDLLINAIGEGTRLFINDGHGRFTERADAGLQRKGGATTLALADVDGDGDLDLYVANYRTTTIRTTGFALLNVGGRRVVPPELRDDLEITPDGKVLEHGEPDCFYLNDGTGHFTLEPWNRGRFLDDEGNPLRKAPRDWGLTATFRDINQDGLPDLYVANDFHSPDRIWINDGAGHFQPLPRLSLRKTSTFSMSVDFGDLDRDGWDDFMLSDMLDTHRERRMSQTTAMEPNPATVGVYDDRPQYDRNTVFWNRGDGTYAEIAHFAGVEAAGWSWSVAFVDVDLDGYEDLLLTTGHLFDTQDLDAAARIERMGPMRREQIPRKLLMFPSLQMPKAAFRNLGNMRFQDSAKAWNFDDSGVCHGMALADLDGDGDLDVVVNNLNAPAGLYRNLAGAARVAIRLRGAGRNTQGIGARVSLVASSGGQAQEIQSGGRYLSSDAPGRSFAWPTKATGARLVVAWRSGKTTTVEGIRPNTAYQVTEPDGPAPKEPDLAARQPQTPEVPGLFIDVSNLISHRHAEAVFDDFQRQPLLPRKLSQPGPGAAWLDLNGDGWEDLVIGASRGGALGVYTNDGRGGLAPLSLPALAVERTVTGLAANPLTGRGLMAALSNFEDASAQAPSLRALDLAAGFATDLPVGLPSTVGPLVAADFDGDGVLELFLAGTTLPGRYPEPASSVLLRSQGGRLVPDPGTAPAFEHLGLVTSALASDLDGDGFPELILASEWGPLRIFRNDRGRLTAWDPVVHAVGPSLSPAGMTNHLSDWTGLWMTVVSGDFDNDGRPDLVAGNWGLNSAYRPSLRHPARIYYGDFDESGTVEVIEASFDTQLGKEVPDRDLMSLQRAVPSLMAKFASHHAFATASLSEVLGEAMARARQVQAVTTASVLLMNRGGFFEMQPLPDQVQWTPLLAAAVADLDGDGWDDLVVAQNYFALQPLVSRLDAGRGLVLHSEGRGRFTPMRGEESGVLAYGEQRGCAVGDFDHDGRVDLALTQNGADTKLYRNATARPGLRVRVNGPAANPLGIGVGFGWRLGDRRGPWREIQSGGGGLSQNSPVQVLGNVPAGAEVEARWPGGRVTRTPIPAGALDLILNAP